MKDRYLVAGTKTWNRRVFDEEISAFPGEWSYTDSLGPEDAEWLEELSPKYVFFLHWSEKVPASIINNYTCIAFHMTDVPYGRGGSPLQNLILRGHQETCLTALKMVAEFDAGPVYGKEPMSLDGSAEDIYIRASKISAGMIKRIISQENAPAPQVGEPTVFKRRKPGESEIGADLDLSGLYDFIRMLDAEGYPRAFLKHGGLRFEFSKASLRDGHLFAELKVDSVDGSGP